TIAIGSNQIIIGNISRHFLDPAFQFVQILQLMRFLDDTNKRLLNDVFSNTVILQEEKYKRIHQSVKFLINFLLQMNRKHGKFGSEDKDQMFAHFYPPAAMT